MLTLTNGKLLALGLSHQTLLEEGKLHEFIVDTHKPWVHSVARGWFPAGEKVVSVSFEKGSPVQVSESVRTYSLKQGAVDTEHFEIPDGDVPEGFAKRMDAALQNIRSVAADSIESLISDEYLTYSSNVTLLESNDQSVLHSALESALEQIERDGGRDGIPEEGRIPVLVSPLVYKILETDSFESEIQPLLRLNWRSNRHNMVDGAWVRVPYAQISSTPSREREAYDSAEYEDIDIVHPKSITLLGYDPTPKSLPLETFTPENFYGRIKLVQSEDGKWFFRWLGAFAVQPNLTNLSHTIRFKRK